MIVEDVVQETLLRAFRDIRTCQARDIDGFARWLEAIGKHQGLNMIKAARAAKRGGLVKAETGEFTDPSSWNDLAARILDTSKSPSSVVAGREAANAVDRCLSSLPEEQGRAMRLRYFHDMSESEVGATMSKTSDAVHGLVVRARASMRRLLGRSSHWLRRS